MMVHRDSAGQRTLSGWHVLFAIVGFFAVIFAVNGTFLYAALSTNTGIVAIEPYRKGLEYNTRIHEADEQKARGWTHALKLSGTRDRLEIVLKDRVGDGVRGLVLKGFVGRPSSAAEDIALSFKETAPGVYTAAIAQLSEGRYLVNVEAGMAGEPAPRILFRMKERLWLKP